MRAIRILQDKLEGSLGFMHAKQRAALWRVVEGLLNSQKLCLTALGRGLPGDCVVKHRIKAVDRFVGSAAIQASIPRVYEAIANLLLGSTERPVLLIDWTGAAPGFFTLSAKIAFSGRAVSILSRTYPESKKSNVKVERAFLDELKQILPAHCRPVLVTDAGFFFRWVDSVKAYAWDYIARVRYKKMRLNIGGRWMTLGDVYKLATRTPRNFPATTVGQANPRTHRAVLSAKPKLAGRTRLGRKGKPLTGSSAGTSRAAAREPLLLITSLSEPAPFVVKVYRLRMQIEETFRDLKSYRYGWSARLIRSAQLARFDVLYMIAAIAAVAMHMLGLAARGSCHARGLQANTERHRHVFSTFFLGKLVMKQGLYPKLLTAELKAGLTELVAGLQSADRIPS